MPPKNAIDRSNSEGRLELAVHAINTKKIASIREASRVYDVPRRTLDRRLRGVNSRDNIHLRKAAPRQSQVRDIANLLLIKRGTSTITIIRKNWVSNFIKQYPKLRVIISRQYNY
ncbi:hypothetical protein N7470_000699 [Penicillium chermesinum]|nr:hypothetical protein N7470_000699 [Penicillium chermesinum]